jgi:hypothetical protein
MRREFLRHSREALLPVLSLSAFACSHTSPYFSNKLPAHTVPPAEPSRIESTIFLIGDAGEPLADGSEPTLKSLKRQVQSTPDSSRVIFLGDNIYPAGLPATSDLTRQESERRLLEQLRAVDTTRARGIFIPGNHDWARYGPGGWEAVKRQEVFVEEYLGRRGEFLPDRGCPGPVVRDIGNHLRLIVLDTQWWLHDHVKPQRGNSDCATDSREEVLADLQAALAGAGQRAVLVTAHHPLESHGVHGGFYGWRDHLFPLLNFSKYLWIPLPGIGSLYPLVRSFGVSDQDLADRENCEMRHALEAVFTANPPLAIASGHEHTLQILQHSRLPSYLIISGHGTLNHTSPVGHDRNTLFAHQHTGYAKIEVLDSGQVRLAVIEPRDGGDKDGEVFSIWLRDKDDGRPAQSPSMPADGNAAGEN